MDKSIFGAAFAALALATPAIVQAQALPPAVVAVVDSDRIIGSCTVCVAANQQLEAQVTQFQQREQQLGTTLQTEQQALSTALNALPAGQQPDAALTQRVQAFQAQQQAAQQELSGRQQINQRMQPAIVTVMQQRGANIAVPRGATHAINPAVDITDAVLAVVNQNTAALNVNAPPPQAPAAQPPAQQPRPQGR